MYIYVLLFVLVLFTTYAYRVAYATKPFQLGNLFFSLFVFVLIIKGMFVFYNPTAVRSDQKFLLNTFYKGQMVVGTHFV